MFFELNLQNRGLLKQTGIVTLQQIQLSLRFGLALGPLLQLKLQLNTPLLYAFTSLNHIADLSFEFANLCTGFIQEPLRLVQLIGRRKMRLSQRLKIGFNTSQISRMRLKIRHRLLNLHSQFDLFSLCLVALEHPKLLLFQGGIGLQRCIALCHFSLSFQLFQIGIELSQNVFDTGEVFAGVFEPVGCFASSLLVFGNTCSFFQKQTQFFRATFNDAADGALANDGVGPGS